MRIGIREPLTAARAYYVRTDGSNSNSGLTNDAAGAFLTIQYAVDVVCGDLDADTFTCTIQVGPGTYAEAVLLKPYLGTATMLRGDNTTPANVVIAPTTGTCVRSITNAPWRIEGFKLTSTDSHAMTVSGLVNIQNIDFGTCAL